MQTAEILAGGYGLPVLECPEFGEIDMGDWESKSRTDMQKMNPVLFDRFFVNVPLVSCPRNILTKSLDFLKDRISGGNPGKGLAMGIIVAHKIFDPGD